MSPYVPQYAESIHVRVNALTNKDKSHIYDINAAQQFSIEVKKVSRSTEQLTRLSEIVSCLWANVSATHLGSG